MITGQSDTVVIVLAILGFMTSLSTALIGAWIAVKTRNVATKVESVEAKVNGTHALLEERLKVSEAGQNRAEAFTEGEQAQRARQSQQENS
jgi:hypothetical protein